MRRGLRSYARALLLLVAAQAATAAEPISVDGVRIGVHGQRTRFVLDLDGPAAFDVFPLPEPYRVVIDLPPVSWRLGPAAVKPAGLITEFRFGRFSDGVSRVVLDVSGPVRIAKSFALPPDRRGRHRIVIDLVSVSRDAFLAALRPTPAPPPQRPPPAKSLGDRPMIVVDPGHGGIDPGTIGASGTYEKDIALDYARELRAALLATGRYKVALTRDRDTFVRLRKRIAIAHDAGADLFVSLHADAIDNPRFRGGAVYTLSEKASDAEAEALAAKENRADIIAGVDLSVQNDDVVNILIDLAQRETMNESVVLARGVITELSKFQRLLKRSHRFAGFAVLKAPDVPSVLVELGYMSNRLDERMLLSPRHRRKVAAAVVAAIDRYFERQHALNRP